MLIAVLVRGGAHRLDIQANILPLGAVVVFCEHLHLVECLPQILHTERLVLIVANAVLIVQMNGKQLVKSQCKADFVGGIQPGQNRMRRFQIAADAFGIGCSSGNRHHMPHCAADGTVDGFVGLGFDADTDVFIIGQHFIDGFNQLLCRPYRALALCTERSLAGQPQNDQIGAQFFGNIDRAVCAPHSVFPVALARRHKAAVLRAGIHPQTRSNKLGLQAVLVQQLLDAAGIFFDLLIAHIVHIGNSVIVVELYRREAQLGKLGKLGFQIDGVTGFRAVGIRTGMYIPGADGKFEFRHCFSSLHILWARFFLCI